MLYYRYEIGTSSIGTVKAPRTRPPSTIVRFLVQMHYYIDAGPYEDLLSDKRIEFWTLSIDHWLFSEGINHVFIIHMHFTFSLSTRFSLHAENMCVQWSRLERYICTAYDKWDFTI
jgi:hypothetical protein